jgi:hypothetical protein
MRLVALVAALMPGAAAALDVGTSNFKYSSDLVADGYVPFAASGAVGALYGLTKADMLYLCFLADTGDAQATSQATLLAEIRGEAPDTAVPNIPVICVLTQ